MAGGINSGQFDIIERRKQEKQFEKQTELAAAQIDVQNKQLIFQTRKDAIRLAIEATTDAPTYSPQERDGLIMTRAILYEQYMLRGSESVKFTEKKQTENDSIQEKESANTTD